MMVKYAVISLAGKRVATLRGEGNLQFRLDSTTKGSWVLDPRVHGEIRPFSMNVTAAGASGEPFQERAPA